MNPSQRAQGLIETSIFLPCDTLGLITRLADNASRSTNRQIVLIISEWLDGLVHGGRSARFASACTQACNDSSASISRPASTGGEDPEGAFITLGTNFANAIKEEHPVLSALIAHYMENPSKRGVYRAFAIGLGFFVKPVETGALNLNKEPAS